MLDPVVLCIDELSLGLAPVVVEELLEVVASIRAAGVSLLLRLSERMQARRQPLQVLTPPGSPVRAVLELTGLPRVMTLLTSLDPS